MKRRKGSQSEVGMLYQYGVTAHLAAQLSETKHIEDYIIYSSEHSAGKFDDIVARIKLKDQDDWYLYLIQVKYKETKRLNVSDNLKGKRIEYFISDYIQCFNDILTNPNLTCRYGIPNDNIRFGIFCDKEIQTPAFLRQDCTFELNVRQYSEKGDVTNALVPFGKEYFKFVCNDLENSDFQFFFDKCYLYLNQPNYNKLNCLIEKASQIKSTREIINYVKDYFNDDYLYTQGLSKDLFDIELQKIRLVDAIPPLPTFVDLIDDDRITIWNEITTKHDITAVNCMRNVALEPYLYSCLVRKINNLLNINIDWKTYDSNQHYLDNKIINKFLIYSKTKRLRFWIDPPTTLRLLIIELWKYGDLPLILKTHTHLSNFEKYIHLKRSYIVLDDWTSRSEEVTNSKMNIFTSLSSITNSDLQNRILEGTIVSPQGRKPVTLKNLLHDDKNLMSAFTCADVLRMMRKRTPFLKEGYCKGSDYLAFIIEDEECSEISNRIEPYDIGHNIRISYPPGQIDECIKMIQGHAIISQHYTIYHLRKTGEKIVLTQGDPYRLHHRFVDQYGVPLFISNTGESIPIIGQMIERNELRYIPRQLRRVTLPKSFFSSQETQICLLSGDLKLIEHSLEFNDIDGVMNEAIILEKKTYFIKVHKKEDHQYYWRKLWHLKYPIFDIYVRGGKLELLKYKNCKNLHFYISYDGGTYSEQEFLNEIRAGSDEISVVTGDAGIGKSSFLKWLCNNYSTEDYIIFYDLINLQVDLNKSERHRIDLIDFIFKKTQKDLPEQYTEFVSILRQKKKLIWVLDSFDEIRLACENQVLDLIGVISNSGAQIIIATRIENCKILMDQFEIHLIKVEPLEQEDCASYWQLDQVLLANISSELATNPLYLNFLKMISMNREKFIKITKYGLYEKVVNMKIKHCLQTTYQIVHDSDIERAVLLFERLALVALFGKEVIEGELRWTCNNELLDMTKFGIVIRFDEGNYPIFYHRTFVEFLFAQWIAKAYQINMYKSTARHLYKQIFNENKLNILNILFENEELHRAILQTDFTKVRNIIKENSSFEYWNKLVDKLGRTALHAAAISWEYSNYQSAALNVLELVLTAMLQNHCDMNKLDIMSWNWSDYIQDQVFLHGCVFRKIGILKTYLRLQREKIHEQNSSSVIFPTQYFYLLYDLALKSYQFDMISDLVLLQNFENKIFFNVYQSCLGLVPDGTIWSSKDLRCEGLLTLLHIACIYGSASTIGRLIEVGVDVNSRDFFTCRPLHYSIMRLSSLREENLRGRSKNIDAVRLLLEAGALPDIPIKRINRISPLCLGVQTKDVTIVNMLLEAGVNIRHCCADGDTALHFGVRNGSLDIIRCLLRYGMPLCVQNNQNETAMDIAVKRNNTEIIDLFKETENATNVQKDETRRTVYVGPTRNLNSGDRSLDNAIIFGNTPLIEILLRRGSDINLRNKHGWTPLETALRQNNIDVIKLLLSKRADVNLQDRNGNTPLFKAVLYCSTNAIELVLESGANINVANIFGETALHYAISDSNTIVAKLLLEKGACANAQALHDTTPLHAGILIGSEDCVKLLLENGADPEIQPRIGIPSLNTAITKQHKKIIDLLIRNGANVNVRCKLDVTPLFLAVYYNDMATIRLLLEQGANLDDEDIAGYTPLLVAVENGSEDIVRLLLEKGANVNAFTRSNVSALFLSAVKARTHIVNLLLEANVRIDRQGGTAALKLSASMGDISTVKLLLTRGVSANICDDSSGCSALYSAVVYDHADIVELLLENDANVNANCKKFATALHQAVGRKNKNMVKLLIDKGASVNAQSKNGETVLVTAIKAQDANVVEVLLEENAINHGIGSDALGYAIRSRDAKIVKLLLDKDVNVNIYTKSGYTPLYIASVLGEIDIVELLLEHKADVNIVSENEDLPFIAATRKGDVNVARLLIDKGAHIDTACNSSGFTALHLKTYQKDLNFVKFLIKKGTNLNIRTKNGINALEIAIAGGDANIFDALLEGGADINSQTSEGATILSFAAQKENAYFVEVLLSKGVSVITNSVPGSTLLHDCVRERKMNIIKVLLKEKFDLNIQDKLGNTALHIGVMEQNAMAVKLLLENNANSDITNINGETPLDVIVDKICADLDETNRENLAIISMILCEHVRKVNVNDEVVIKSFYWAAEKGHLNIIKLLVRHGINVNLQNYHGYTPLHIAVVNNHKGVVKTLLENGADIGVKTTDEARICEYS